VLNNILSLKQVIPGFVVITHGSLLFPSLLELPLVIHNLFSLCLHLGVLFGHETVEVLPIALLFSRIVGVLLLLAMLYLRLQVVFHCVRLKPALVSEILDHVVTLLGTEVGLLVGDLFLAHLPPRLPVCFHLGQDVLLVSLVRLKLEPTFCLLEHLLLFNVAEELVTLVLALALQVAQVVLEPVVGSFACLSLALVGVFALPLHVAVHGIWTLSVHHQWVAGVERVRNVLAVERPANYVV